MRRGRGAVSVVSAQGIVAAVAAAAAAAGCRDLAGPASHTEPPPPEAIDAPSFVFAADVGGRSQLFVVSAAGGGAVQLTHETGGAFSPAWSDDGLHIIYVAATGASRLRRALLDGGAATDLASDSRGIGQPSCALGVCVAVTDPLGGAGSVVVLSADGRARSVVFERTSREREPAIIVP